MVTTTAIFCSLCWLLECQMATVAEQKGRKSTPKHVIERHEAIVAEALNDVVDYCRSHGFRIDPMYDRVKKAVEAVLENS